ncbi:MULTISPECIES: C40 family peptidase [unclassified Clostridium]|uniref:C40 family peptidase n=1 Tax=unclassified Clostridium TaxID=2614128 RepID=UPI0013FC8DAC|nr:MULTISPECIES: C40 family peptidase [unclassified Clostridium]MBN1046803.1 glycoside hydrolase [Clostridium botulinum]MBN1056689.1 glycoside hydrolase [Clostridium botulinum]NFN94220.1 glycoside hydrolase [Clostridium botulinum]NFR88073.1 glycoside hydrolase [Clostridium botulinum]NFR90227.1 glycoside hydrolase [Clostridium botulinum]
MRKKILAAMLATMIIAGSSAPAFATPGNQELNETRQKYAEIERNINEIQDKIYDLDAQIEPLEQTVSNNKKEVKNINTQIDNTTKDIGQCKEEITNLDLALGERLKAIYMSGNMEFSYLNFLFESESTSDFFTRAESLGRILGRDKKAIKEIAEKRDSLNEKITSLEDKKKEIDKLNAEVQVSLSELDVKKKDQEVLVEKTKDEKKKFDEEYLSQMERDVVKSQIDVINSSSSSLSDLKSAISQLRNIRDSQLKSPIVIEEVNAKIESGKSAVSQKEQEEEAKKAAAAAASANTPNRGNSGSTNVTVPSAGNAQAILNEAYNHLGKAYVYGATGPSNFDCSGFTQYVYRKAAGVDISRTTYSQIGVGVSVSRDQLQPGDLVFPHAGHVGIYVGGGNMIHAPQTGDVVKVSPVYNFYAARRIL